MRNQSIENIALMEPLIFSETSRYRPELAELVMELGMRATGFKHSLPTALTIALAETVRSMNCYYSNLIEGHNTHPIDIERALQGDYSSDNKKRNLQLEAKAHIAVQAWLDENRNRFSPYTTSTICEIHQRFYELLPDELCWAEDPLTKDKEKVIPGKLRHVDVQVGNHVTVHPTALPPFLARYESIYSSLNKTESLLAIAAAHHRLLWIHPFLDGNGRVTRLMSHYHLLNVLDTGSIWSIARGLARRSAEYKELLANCDLPRRNDLDGRGQLSEEELVKFTRFFLENCLDQIKFMETLMQPDRLRTRILLWAKEEMAVKQLPANALQILEAILYRGEITRGELADSLDVSERHLLRSTKTLVEKGVIVSETQKSPFRLAFPATLAHRFLPGLFPEP